jgi:hypothetical protein
MTRQKSLAVILCAAVLGACDYEKNAVQDITAPDTGSRIRFFNFGVNAPGVNFYANDTKVTGISTAACSLPPASETEPCTTTGIEATTGTAYGGVGLAGLYSAVDPGQYTFTGRIAATIDKDLPISTVATALTNGTSYSFYQSGFYDAVTKTVDAFVVEDPIPPAIDFTVAHVRFVHAISNGNPMTLYATNTAAPGETTIGGEVAYKAGSAFIALPGGTYNLATRYAGVTTNALTRTGVGFVAGRVYTITARGDITVAPTTTGCAAANRTCLDNTVNR